MKKILLLLSVLMLTVGGEVWAETYYTSGDDDGNSFQFESTDGTTATITWVYLGGSATSLTIPTTVWSNVSPYPSFTVTAVGEGSYAINNSASAITSLTISSGITTISQKAFDSWTGLTTVEFPSTLTSIGDYAFQACDALTSITSYSSSVTLGTEAFKGNSSWDYIAANCVLKVPDGAALTYAANSGGGTGSWTYWDAFYSKNNIHELSYPSITTEGWGTYYNTYGYTMPSNVEGYLINWTYNGSANLVKVYDPGEEVVANIALLWKSTVTLDETTWYTVEALASGGNTATWPKDDSETSYTNLLQGTQAEGTTIAWADDVSGYMFYGLSNGSNGLGWYWRADDGGVFTNGAHKAYMAISNGSSARSFISMFDDETAIKTLEEEEGSLLSTGEEATVYDLMGRRVSQPAKGNIYVVNGKKVMY